jgi:hypothetical protein
MQEWIVNLEGLQSRQRQRNTSFLEQWRPDGGLRCLDVSADDGKGLGPCLETSGEMA